MLVEGNPAGQPVILLHGFMQTGGSWRYVAERLAARGCFVFAPDLTGHGEDHAACTLENYSFQSHVERLGEQMERYFRGCGCGGELHHLNDALPILVGYSMGGRIAAAFACQHPYAVSAVVLESAGLGPRTEAERTAREQKAQAQARLLMEAPLSCFVDRWEELPLFASQKRLPAKARAAIRAERLSNDPERLAFSLVHAGQHCMPNLRPALARLPVPLLYLAGGLDVAYTENARELARQGVSTHILEGLGHNLHAENPDAFCDVIEHFFEQEGLI